MQKIIGRCKFLKDWTDWDDSVHADEAQIVRQGKAMTYPFDFVADREKQRAWFSSTTLMPYYDTHLDRCDCGDFQERGLPCKHIYRLAVELGVIEIIKRPSFDKDKVKEIKASNDIDSTPDQIKRQKSAEKCKVIAIDYENKTGIFAGSGKTPYQTTVDACTCRDFFVRRLPCKHIYRLRDELEKVPKS